MALDLYDNLAKILPSSHQIEGILDLTEAVNRIDNRPDFLVCDKAN